MNTRKSLVVGLAIIAFALLAAACSSSGDGSRSAGSSSAGSSPAGSSPAGSSPAAPAPSSPGTASATHFTVADIWAVGQGAYRSATLVADPSYSPVPGTYPDAIVTAGGVAGRYANSSGDSIVIAGAQGSFAANEAKIAATSTQVAGYPADVHVYQVQGGGTSTGDYEVFAPGYWFSLTSDLFSSPEAARGMIGAALQVIPSG